MLFYFLNKSLPCVEYSCRGNKLVFEYKRCDLVGFSPCSSRISFRVYNILLRKRMYFS